MSLPEKHLSARKYQRQTAWQIDPILAAQVVVDDPATLDVPMPRTFDTDRVPKLSRKWIADHQ